ncbi:polyprenyl synthetase [Lentzea atacamensis]|uniref:Polyprenyl synthetase n=1 Tax=Lentzea atacamensis TaxID=531938 RepID=A0A316IIE2_9PSEU|nr:polyprenyl synthetase family protein [Lentzea atacamensis]PWK86959.1 polyprenyl synthetase [Lentzea atacamensis]
MSVGRTHGWCGIGSDHGTFQLGQRLGLAFQLIDDLLGIWGSPRATGKPADNDLLAGKKALPVAAAPRVGQPVRKRVRRVLRPAGASSPGRDQDLAMLVEAAGGRDWARRTAERELVAAGQQLTAARCKPDAAGNC